MSDIKDIPIQELGSENSGENCAANEPFALRILDSSMSPEFEVDHIIIIDPSITPKSGDFVVYETRSSIIIREIIISDKTVDQYESNLMRRICGLIYFPDKMSAEIKLKIISSK